jgi:hypothetical protein
VDLPGTSGGTGFLQTGLAWYRKHFTLPPELAGQRISVEFDGVYMNSTVWLNGQLLGNHPYAYTSYSFDVTSLVHTDGVTENVLAVQVPSAQPSSRWYSGSGIFRNVYLVVTSPVHVARHGTFVTYQASSVPAFNGKALVIIGSAPGSGSAPAGHGGRITVTATSPGLRSAQVTLGSVAAHGGRARAAGAGAALAAATARRGTTAARGRAHAGPVQAPAADASYSGAPGAVPAAMLDGNLSTGWSNYYNKAQTANLRAVSVSNPGDWVALSWPRPQSIDSVVAYFTTGGPLALPATIAVSHWNGHQFAPVRNLAIDWATASNQPTTLTFDPVRGTRLRLDMTSAAPGTGGGFLMIAELQARSDGVKIT